jgi:hypothetical protein
LPQLALTAQSLLTPPNCRDDTKVQVGVGLKANAQRCGSNIKARAPDLFPARRAFFGHGDSVRFKLALDPLDVLVDLSLVIQVLPIAPYTSKACRWRAILQGFVRAIRPD